MKTEDIIEGLNKYIESKRQSLNINSKGHLVLQKTIKPYSTFKAYKECQYIVWFIKNSKKYKVISISMIDKILEGHEDAILRKMNIKLCETIFEWINSITCESIIQGDYDGNTNE